MDGNPDDVPEVDLYQLQVNTLRRYKKHYKISSRPGLNKAQLADVSAHATKCQKLLLSCDALILLLDSDASLQDDSSAGEGDRDLLHLYGQGREEQTGQYQARAAPASGRPRHGRLPVGPLQLIVRLKTKSGGQAARLPTLPPNHDRPQRVPPHGNSAMWKGAKHAHKAAFERRREHQWHRTLGPRWRWRQNEKLGWECQQGAFLVFFHFLFHGNAIVCSLVI